MNVNSLNKSANLYSASEQKAIDKRQLDDTRNNENVKKGDTLEISNQAKQLSNVKLRIEQGFYDRPEILRQVARKIDEELNSDDTVI